MSWILRSKKKNHKNRALLASKNLLRKHPYWKIDANCASREYGRMGTHKIFNGISRGFNKVNYYCLQKPKEQAIPCQNCIYSSKEEAEGWRWKTHSSQNGFRLHLHPEIGGKKDQRKVAFFWHGHKKRTRNKTVKTPPGLTVIIVSTVGPHCVHKLVANPNGRPS